uniref:Aminotransferase class I/classII large domain-containing protein n=1 Tax=Meloidogyne enterolobii TaxID=390850 RepID=A0A6V7XUV3_MELEN|nr:unnamed protein product [Meloidogyne enterolobii]
MEAWFLIVHDRCGGVLSEIKKGIVALSQKIVGPCALIQGALPSILRDTPSEFFDNTKKLLASNASIVYDKLSRVPGLRPLKPQGAMYMMVGFDPSLFGDETKFVRDDDLPVLELNALRDLSFIIESYLFHICFIDQLDQAKAVVPPIKISRATRGNSEIRQYENDEQKKSKLRRFFKRSNSISYSTLSDAVKHHAFTYTAADVLPLSVLPYLLNSEAD